MGMRITAGLMAGPREIAARESGTVRVGDSVVARRTGQHDRPGPQPPERRRAVGQDSTAGQRGPAVAA
ncbi:hypothetical protein ACIQGZ_06280 [Streptomyces sp. NPDC092296]|uniref:hypothetical protein n=1 Tax=Streptomyces sp. NPDC092296 TaxID=3366012 RepID=UPI0037F19803